MYLHMYYVYSPSYFRPCHVFVYVPHQYFIFTYVVKEWSFTYIDGLQKFLSNPADRVREAYWHPNSPTEFTHDEMMVRYHLGLT